MSRKKRKYSSEGFAMIYREVVESYAFKALTNPARVAYLLLKIQVKSAGQQDVKYPYSHAAEYMDRHTFAKAIRQ